MSLVISAFACWHKSRDESQASIINATTAGKARYQYFLDISDCCPDLKIMDIKVRKVGGPHSSELFETGRFAGQTLNCHPCGVELLP